MSAGPSGVGGGRGQGARGEGGHGGAGCPWGGKRPLAPGEPRMWGNNAILVGGGIPVAMVFKLIAQWADPGGMLANYFMWWNFKFDFFATADPAIQC